MKKRQTASFYTSKKALAVDLDWIISLGIFLIYLGVFFVAIRQLPTQQSPAAVLLENVLSGITDSTKWSVQKLPLVITSNISGIEPVIVRFPYEWKNFSFRDKSAFDRKDSRLIFTRALSQGKNVLELVTSSEDYTQPPAIFELAASPNSASVDSKRFFSEFQNSLLLRVNHFDKERLSNFNISISGLELKPETANTSTNITALSAQYKLSFTQLNHTSIIVAGYPRIFSYVTTDAKEPHNIDISATLSNYTFFYINDALSGTINYTTRGCAESSGRYIDFYDDISGVSFILPEGGSVSFCAGNTTVRLGLQFPIGNETRYDIIFHQGDYNGTLKYVSPYKTALGIVENVTGLSLQLYSKINGTDYQTLKRSWNYPNSREFGFALYNNTGELFLNYQPKASGITNVFAKEADVFVLDKYATKTRHKLRIKGW
ncbi:hypothetical protein HYV83_05500 [Candidatus Woesearchaeota archaeon]|nr:hypothetical protein [Candidatus Woesearchaeota archaeon]